MRLFVSTLAVSTLLGLTAASCGSTSRCTPQNCKTGCCDNAGECRTGAENSACGSNGNTCVNCTALAQTCGNQVCVATSSSGGGGGSAAGGGGGSGGSDGGADFCLPQPVECADQVIQGLDLKTGLAPGLIQNTADGTGFLSTIDSRGGGFPPTQSYVYARFTANGLDKAPLDDMQALDSMDWDIAFRRFVIRINSGDSGPGCVAGATLPNGTAYASVTSVPSGIGFEEDDFIDRPPACVFIPDGSGLDSSPRTYLSAYYAYPRSCVEMTGRVFILKAGNGRHVKLTVDTYYATQAGQGACNTSGASGGVAGGTIRMRWAFLD